MIMRMSKTFSIDLSAPVRVDFPLSNLIAISSIGTLLHETSFEITSISCLFSSEIGR